MHIEPHWDGPRPYVHVDTPAGARLTVDAPPDHPWHHALWSTIKFVDGMNFWEEYGEFGLLKTTGVEVISGGARAAIEWVRPDGAVPVREARTIVEVPIEGGAYAIDWTVELGVPQPTVFDRTPFTTWGGYGGLTFRGAAQLVDTAIRLPDGEPRDRVLGERAPWCALSGTAADTGAPAGIAMLDHPDNTRYPTNWYGSTRADTYGEGWANFLNAAFLWDDALTVESALTLRHRVLVFDGTRDAEWFAARSVRVARVTELAALADRLVALCDAQLSEFRARYAPDFVLPRVFAGHMVAADVLADLVFTLGHLHAAGVTTVAGRDVEALIIEQLGRVEGPSTHTFFSYRIAETLLDRGAFEGNPLLRSLSDEQREQVAIACDSSDWVQLLDDAKLPRNYAGVLSRCERARNELGLVADSTALDSLVQRLRALLSEGTIGFLDDSHDQSGRIDIYTADIWLFTEPLADRLGPVWEQGVRVALDLVDSVVNRDGSAIAWGRSTGVLSIALTIELAALAIAQGIGDAGAWLRRAIDATDTISDLFVDGLCQAHAYRDQDGYRGPARRLQLTFDVLGKLSWAARTLRAVGDVEVEPAGADRAYPNVDRVFACSTERNAAVWALRAPGISFALPFVGAARSHYLPAPYSTGTFEPPVDRDHAVWAPFVLSGLGRYTTAHVPATLEHTEGSLRATWDHFDSLAFDPVLDATRTMTMTVDGRSVVVDDALTFATEPRSVSVAIPEIAARPLRVELEAAPAGARISEVPVAGLAEWRSPWSEFTRVHQVELSPASTMRYRIRVTPHLRVASTAFGHHYDRSLYGPLADRVVERPSPIGPLGDASVRLRDLDVFHMHWPEWLLLDDADAHQRAIDELRSAGVRIVWTAHNLTPHAKQPDVFDAVYARWAAAADATIHHSRWGEQRMRARYDFAPRCEHVVIPHGHFGALYPSARFDRDTAAGALGLPPAPLRIGIVGAPRAEKHVQAFIDAFERVERGDVQLACWSLSFTDRGSGDPRVHAHQYRMVDDGRYGLQLAACDVLALPFDPDGDMLATGTLADAIGYGIPCLTTAWDYVTEMLGDAAIVYDADRLDAAIAALDPQAVAQAAQVMAALRDQYAWPALADQTFALLDRVVTRLS